MWQGRGRALLEGVLEEPPCPGSQGKLISQPDPCARASLTLSLASSPAGGKCHLLMRCDGEEKERGKGDPASATDLLCKSLPLACPQFPSLNIRQEQ